MILATSLLLIGLAFVLAEVFFPSLGLFGLIATGAILLADVIAFEQGDGWGWLFIGAEVLLVPLVVYGGFRILPRLPFGRRMILAGPTLEPGAGSPDHMHLLDRQGIALTDLRPAGTARFGDERLSVVSVGGLVEENTPIRVIAIEGNEVRVRALRPETPEPSRQAPA
jgi:membrane-bound serine protease (ClpP class)